MVSAHKHTQQHTAHPTTYVPTANMAGVLSQFCRKVAVLAPFLLAGVLMGSLLGPVRALPRHDTHAGLYAQTTATTTTTSGGGGGGGVGDICIGHYNREPSLKEYPYRRVLAVKPRIQWMDAGGYCGSLAVQNVALAQGAWISQQQVRNHTVPGGGHDEEILATNIDLALQNLKLRAEGWKYKTEPVPQLSGYLAWIKKHLANGSGIAWMIMLAGGRYPVCTWFVVTVLVVSFAF